MCICKGVGVCAYSGVEVDGYLSEAFSLHLENLMQSKFRQFHYAGLHKVSSSLQLKKQLCHKMSPKKTNCFSSSNLTVTI